MKNKIILWTTISAFLTLSINVTASALLASAAPVDSPPAARVSKPYIEEALEIIDGLLVIKAMDPHLLHEAPADAPPPDFSQLKLQAGLFQFFYSEVEAHRKSAFHDYIQQPLFKALKLFAKVTYDHPQTFANVSETHPLGFFMAFDTFESADELPKLRLLFLKVQNIGKEQTEEKKRRVENGDPKLENITNATIHALEEERDAMLKDHTSLVNRFAHYVYDVEGLKFIEEAIQGIETSNTSTFTGRLSILREIQVIGEVLNNLSPIVMQNIDNLTQKVFKDVRNNLVHFSKRRFNLVKADVSAKMFAEVQREVLGFKARFLEIKIQRTEIEKAEAVIIWEGLKRSVDPLAHGPIEWANLKQLVKDWAKGKSNSTPSLHEKLADLIEVVEATRELAGIGTDYMLEVEKAKWAEIVSDKLMIMQKVWDQVHEPTLARSALEDLDRHLSPEARKKLGDELREPVYPGGKNMHIPEAFVVAPSRAAFNETMARFMATQERFITRMETDAAALSPMDIDVPKVTQALRDRSRANRVVELRRYQFHQIFVGAPWSVPPPPWLIEYLSAPEQATFRSALAALIPIICRQAVKDLSGELPALLKLREVGNYYAHPQPGRVEKPALGDGTEYSRFAAKLAQDIGFLTINCLYSLQEFQKALPAPSAGAGAGNGSAFASTSSAADEKVGISTTAASPAPVSVPVPGAALAGAGAATGAVAAPATP